VLYELSRDDAGAELNASLSMSRGGGLTGRIVANAAAALLKAGALDGATGRIARAAEARPGLAAAA
jgi:hypothetical protein